MMNKYGNMLTIILVVAIVLVVGVLGFFAYRVYTDKKTIKNAADFVTEFDDNTANIEGENNQDNQNNEENSGEENTNQEQTGPSLEDILANFGGNTTSGGTSTGTTTTKKDTYYNGYKVIGTISIPSINVQCPILEENVGGALDVAVVAVHPKDTANAVNKPGNLVIWGHYSSSGESAFFANIDKLTTGAKIYIKDTTGTKLEYQVYNTYETSDSDMTYATRNTDGAREITLSSCTNISGRRRIVWARETGK